MHLLAIALGLALTEAVLAGPIAPKPTATPVPTQVKHVSPTIAAIGGGSGPCISPSISKALAGKAQGEYRLTSTQSVTWNGTAITASTRYLGSKVITEVFDQP